MRGLFRPVWRPAPAAAKMRQLRRLLDITADPSNTIVLQPCDAIGIVCLPTRLVGATIGTSMACAPSPRSRPHMTGGGDAPRGPVL
jgi:hypothetical protein